MSAEEPLLHESDCTYALVTGVNSGLGFAICCRLVDEFLTTRPAAQSLRLITTTRDEKKSTSTVARLKKHLAHHPRRAQARISFQPERLDLTSLQSVHTLAAQLRRSVPKLDAIVLNAGIGGFIGINWPAAVWNILTDFMGAVTSPTYKRSGVGWTTLPQTSSNPDLARDNKTPHPPLAEVFCANVFGHYVLTHQVMPLLSRPSSAGRIIWISSLEAFAPALSTTDLQGLRSQRAYESSKRLTDVLALTASLPCTRPFVTRFLTPPTYSEEPHSSELPSSATPSLEQQSTTPHFYLAHPGICATAIISLPLILHYLMIATMYVARWLESPWHTVHAYKGARAPVWLVLGQQEDIDAAEASEASAASVVSQSGTVSQTDIASHPSETRRKTPTPDPLPQKWGSSTNRTGRERVRATLVEGRGQEGWEELGRECWMEMEALRNDWEARIS